MAIFEDEPGDYGDGGLEAPPAPWEFGGEASGGGSGSGGGSSGGGGGSDGGGGDTGGDSQGDYELSPPKEPVDPNDWTQSERALQEKWIPQTNPGPLPPPYSTYYGPAGERYGFFPQQPGIPESMFQQGKGWTPSPQFHETTTFTPNGYAETTTSPSNWMTPQPKRSVRSMMMIQPRGGGGGGSSYPSGPSIPPEVLRQFINLLRYGGIQRI